MDEIKKYLIKFSDETIKGPLLKEEIEDMIYDNILSGDELIKEYPEGEWVNISSIKHFYDVFIGFFELEKNINSNKKKTIIDFKTEKVKKPEDLDKTKILKKETKEKTEIYTEQEKEKISNLVIKDKIKASLNTEEKSPLIPRSVIKTKTDEIKKKDKTPIIVITIIVLASILFFIPKDKEQKISIEGVEVKKELIELKLPVAESEDYSPTESRRLRLRALELLEKDNINSYNAAITDLLEGFRLNISNGALLSYLAYTYANLYGISKRDAEFLNALKSIITRAERTDVNVESLALAQISFLNITNRFDESINIFNSILTKVENLSDVSPLLLILAADTSIKNSDYQTAYKIIEQLKEMYPERFPRIYYLEGMIRKNNRELDLATKSFEQALKINPSHSQSQVELFIINQESSINNILKFLATNSPNTNHEDISKLLVILANRLAEEKDTIKAKNLYKKALDFYPANTDALIAYERLGGDINKYQNLALLDPAKQADLNVFLLRGDELMNVYKYRDAALQYRMATSINDKDSIAWYKLGVAYSFSYEYEKAISSFKKSLEINSLDINTLIKLARVQIDLYMFVEASENLERALKLDPEHPDTIFTIGYLNDKRNLEKEAIDYYHKAVSKDFSHKEALFILGEKNFKYERYPEAKLLFEKVLTAKPDDFASYMYIIRILSKTEHIDKVKRYVDNLEKIFPNAAEVNTGM
ncbi:MAG: hypothetical protein PHT84_04830, partial [Candidatus Pacebacteria bacterium]|nr:hypothetical protein [Candidatus Paceibacterota bacterium]